MRQHLSSGGRPEADADSPAPGELAEMEQESGWIVAAQVDPAAFEPLYARYRERVYRYARTHLGSAEDAADLTQQVFLQALAALPRYRTQGVPFAVWLFRIARYAMLNRLRRNPTAAELSWDQLPEPLHPLAHEEPEEQALRNEARQHLRDLLAELEQPERELLALRFAGGLTAPQIAALVGRKPEAVRKQIYRLVQSFKEQFRA